MCKFIAERIITCQCTNENLGNSLTKRDFRLQSGNLVYKMRFSFTKRDSWVTNGTLALHFTEYGEELKEIVFEMLHHTRSTAENLYYLQGKLYQFFSVLARGIEIQQYSNDTKESIHVQEAIAYIKNYYSQKITVEDIANYLALNRSYLYTIFMNSLGISPKEFLTEFRISRGKEQLALTNLSVEEIAVSCGYRNSLAFGKVFKQKVGITPTQYRNDNRKDARERLIRAQNELKEYKKHKTIYVGNIEKE